MIVIDAVVLAAGQSARLGRAKQLLSFAGAPLLAHAVGAVLGAAPRRLLVVVGARAAEVRRALPDSLHPIDVVDNPEWLDGIGSSIGAGMRALLARGPDEAVADGVLLAVCDQPLVPPAHFARLRKAFARAPERIVASHYQGTAGVPAVFPRARFTDLLGLPVDSGACRIITRHQAEVVRVPCAEAAFDVDTRADVARLATIVRPDVRS